MQVPLIDTYIEKFAPAFQNAGQAARAQCERVITRLEAIEAAIRDSEFQEYREITRANLKLASGLQLLEEIPVGTDWELQFITIVGVANITLTDGAGAVLGFPSPVTPPQTFDSFGFVARGGTTILASTSADCAIYAQWKVRKPKAAHRGYIGGRQNPVPDGTGDYGGPGRHAAMAHIVGANYPE